MNQIWPQLRTSFFHEVTAFTCHHCGGLWETWVHRKRNSDMVSLPGLEQFKTVLKSLAVANIPPGG